MTKNNFKKRKFKFPIKIITLSLFSLLAIFSILFFSARYLKTSDYFKVKNCECFIHLDKTIREDRCNYLTEFLGRNIFDFNELNLKKAAQRLSRLHPEYKQIIIRRSLPDRIIIDFKPRQAVARIKVSEYFYVDEEGVLFHPIGKEDDNLQLPLIIGLEARISRPRSGVKYNENSLLKTLEFIDNLNKDSKLSGQLKIKKINLANVNDVFLFAVTGCKINLGGIGSLNKNLSILQRLIGEINSDLTKIEYIDLRFREPVVKYR